MGDENKATGIVNEIRLILHAELRAVEDRLAARIEAAVIASNEAHRVRDQQIVDLRLEIQAVSIKSKQIGASFGLIAGIIASVATALIVGWVKSVG